MSNDPLEQTLAFEGAEAINQMIILNQPLFSRYSTTITTKLTIIINNTITQ